MAVGLIGAVSILSGLAAARPIHKMYKSYKEGKISAEELKGQLAEHITEFDVPVDVKIKAREEVMDMSRKDLEELRRLSKGLVEENKEVKSKQKLGGEVT